MTHNIRTPRLLAILVACTVIVPLFAIQIPDASAGVYSGWSLPRRYANSNSGYHFYGGGSVLAGDYRNTHALDGSYWTLDNPNSGELNEYIQVTLAFDATTMVEAIQILAYLGSGGNGGFAWFKVFNIYDQ